MCGHAGANLVRLPLVQVFNSQAMEQQFASALVPSSTCPHSESMQWYCSVSDDQLEAMMSHWKLWPVLCAQVPVVAANRIGTEKFSKSEITFYGGSFIADPKGAIVAQVWLSSLNIQLPPVMKIAWWKECVLRHNAHKHPVAARQRLWSLYVRMSKSCQNSVITHQVVPRYKSSWS